MIKSFDHKGLRKFFETGSNKGIQVIHADRLSLLLSALNAMTQIDDLQAPSFRLHKLKGDKKNFGQSQYRQIGELLLNLKMEMYTLLTIWTITRKE